MTARAFVQRDFRGVRLAVSPDGGNSVILWNAVGQTLDDGVRPPEEAWLNLSDETARAIHEALAEHFGVAASNAVLQAQNEALAIERGRVDTLLAFVCAE